MRLVWGLIVLTLAGCPASAVTVPTGKGTDYPCGVHGHVCPSTHLCCDEEDVCGGEPFSGCPAQMCCFVGGVGALGARKGMYSQWSAK